jgi:hypothetical protein
VFWYWAQSENIKVCRGCILSVSWMYYPESRASCQALYAQRCSIDCYCTWTHTQISCHTYSCSLWWWHDGIVLLSNHYVWASLNSTLARWNTGKKISSHKSQERGARYLWFMVLQTPTARN